MSEDTKTCTKCGKVFPATTEFFHKRSRVPSGLYASCKKCERARNAENTARYRSKNRESLKQAARTRYQENREEEARKARERRARNPEPHREAVRKSSRRRRAIKRGVESSPYLESEVLDLYGTDCHLCQLPIDLTAPRHASKGKNWEFGLHVDHLIPLSKGGVDSLDNVRPAHAVCNQRKYNKTSTEA